MQPQGKSMRHWRMVNRMAKTTQTDLAGAFDEGRLTPESWAKIVGACQGCTWVEGCDSWLDTHDNEYRAPHTCPNRARFAVLRAAQDAELA